MALDNGYPFAGQSLPTPSDTPYQTPSRALSGRSSRQASSSPYSNYSPAQFPPGEDSYFPANDAGDERYSVRDPRRLTQNLDMSLVSQIHSLKKELESKDALVQTLEESLHQTRSENERLTEDATAQKVEVKSVKFQMQSLERDMLQQFENTVSERNNAIDSVADTRKRLEDSKKKVRAQEEDADRSHALWEKDRRDLEDKNRKLEGRNHVLEGKNHVLEEHLKTMAAAMDAQNIAQNQPGADVGNDNFGARTGSRQSNRSLDDIYEDKEATNFRDSRMNGLRRPGGSQVGGLSLAEELELGDDDEDDEDDDEYHRAMRSPNAFPEENQPSRRYSEDEKARKVMGFHDRSSSQASVTIKDAPTSLPRKQPAVSYTDTAMQCSPPPSPMPQMRQMEIGSEKTVEQTEHAANQSRKRVAIPNILVEQTSTAKSEALKAEATKASRMVSAGCQTVAEITANVYEALVFAPASVKETKSSSTQTSDDGLPRSNSASNRLSPPPMDVPVIAIHPPASRPASSHNGVVLPPRTKNAGCQVVIEMPRSQRSTSMQTEVQTEKRSVRIPPRLQFSHPSAQSSSQYNERRTQAPETPQASAVESSKRIVPVVPPKSSRRAIPSPPIETDGIRQWPASPKFEDAYPGNNDNGPLNGKDRSGPRRPIRSESIFAGFDATDDGNEKVPSDFSDDSFGNAAPIRKTLSKVQNSWKLVPQSNNAVLDILGSATTKEKGEQQSKDSNKKPIAIAKGPSQTTSKTFQTKVAEIHRKPPSTTKEADVRRQALVSKGIAEHAQRARSPSAPNAPGKEVATIPPPFPVPTRSSSRRIPVSASDGAVSPSPYTTSFFTARRGQDPSRPSIKRRILRKTQSAAAVTKPSGPAYPSPPLPKSSSSSMPGRPKSPRVLPNQFVLPYDDVAELPHQLPKVTGPKSHAGGASIEAPSQQTSVVDAIAQTMVGEWMWKYVRKRTSFGVTETPAAEFEMVRSGEAGNSSGVRHKRWVWLAPYENAVIWSSKQPTSGPALLGKGGRKLTIQSVLDVKDDTPLPKNAGSQSAFDRSILILTPERALKFTATSRDRHYIWLTALSFLSHSTQGMIELTSPPPMPEQEYQAPLSQRPSSGFRRTPIRDSIRVAKDKSRPSVGSHSYSSPTGEIAQESIQGLTIGFQGTTIGWGDSDRLSEDAAEPPQVPRIAAHARKRSSTGPRPVPLSAFHSYPGNSISLGSSFSSRQAPTSRDKYDRCIPRSRGGLAVETPYDMTPYIESYTPPLPVVPDNFYDRVGTMRMEAFVEKNENRYAEPSRGKREARSHRTRQARKKDISSFWGVAESRGSSGAPNLRLRSDDPFTGF